MTQCCMQIMQGLNKKEKLKLGKICFVEVTRSSK